MSIINEKRCFNHGYNIVCVLNAEAIAALESCPVILSPLVGPGVPSPRKTAIHFQLLR